MQWFSAFRNASLKISNILKLTSEDCWVNLLLQYFEESLHKMKDERENNFSRWTFSRLLKTIIGGQLTWFWQQISNKIATAAVLFSCFPLLLLPRLRCTSNSQNLPVYLMSRVSVNWWWVARKQLLQWVDDPWQWSVVKTKPDLKIIYPYLRIHATQISLPFHKNEVSDVIYFPHLKDPFNKGCRVTMVVRCSVFPFVYFFKLRGKTEC